MRWSLKIGRVAGTVVQIHFTFFLLLAWIAGMYYFDGGAQAAFDGTLFILLIFLCVLLHEFGHALAARYFGIETPDITLLPIGGVARLERMPEEPGQELVIALAGPAVNVVIAAGLFAFLGTGLDPDAVAQIDETQIGMLDKLFGVNVFLVIFNLIPAFPMDGGRVLRALLAYRLSYARATRIAASVGQVLALGFGLLGLFGNLILVLIAVFIFFGAAQEAAVVEMRESTRGLRVADAMVPDVSGFDGSETPEGAARRLLSSGLAAAILVDDSGQPRGAVSRQKLFETLRQGGAPERLDALATDPPTTVREDAVLNDALQLMQSEGHHALPVVDADGMLVGLLSFDSVGEMLVLASNRRDADQRPDDRTFSTS